MKIKSNLIGHVFGLALIASCVALQVPSQLVYSSGELSRCLDRSPSVADRTGSNTVARSYGDLPLSFEVNRGQSDSRVKFLARGSGYNLYLTTKEAVMGFHARLSPKNEQRHSATATEHASYIGMKLVGANAGARIIGLDEMPGKSNYFIGSDPKKWRVNIPNYSRVKYQNAYPGVDVVFYGKGRQLEYDFIVAPGADFRTAQIALEGVRGVRLDASGDLLIATSTGEIRERKPAIYQEADGAKQPVEGGYVIRGESEIGFEVRHYDSNRTLIIDPVIVYSTTFGGSYNETPSAIAVDKQGNAYIAGTTDSPDFPTVSAFQSNLKTGGVNVGISSDAFVAKLNSGGTALLYSTYLGGSNIDGASGIAVDAQGNAYLTGYTASTDFPATPDAFQAKAVSGGSAFVTKLNAGGNALAYSTYLGGSGSNSYFFPLTATGGTGIAVDADGSAYATGYTFSRSFPLERAIQGELNRGLPFNCCAGCLHSLSFGLDPIEDAFVTKLNPSGTGLVYSTYLGGTGQDEAYGIAIDASGSAYVTGRTCSGDFERSGNAVDVSDAFLAKLSSSGRTLVYARLLGGSGDDTGNGIAVDASGNAYVAGQTNSLDFPTTPGAFQANFGGSVSYNSSDGGTSWDPASGLPNAQVNVLAIDPISPSTIYAGLGSCFPPLGVFKSTDGGVTWKPAGSLKRGIYAIAVDPKSPSTVYADRYKSTDGGNTWSEMPVGTPRPIRKLVIDPINATNVYLVTTDFSCSDVFTPWTFFRSTDGGSAWAPTQIDPGTPGATSLAIDPMSPSTIYATTFGLYKSLDKGITWRAANQLNQAIRLLAIDPANAATLYAKTFSISYEKLIRSTDGGNTFGDLGLANVPIDGLAIDPANSSILYAAIGVFNGSAIGGGVFKSTDGGQTWKPTDLTGITVNALAIDSTRIHAGTYFDTDGFLAKVTAAGAIVYSTYLGTRSSDAIAGIGVDAAGNVYLTGRTFSDRFPTKDALQERKAGSPFETSTFATTLNTTGSALLYSTYLGSEVSFGSAVAVDAAGKAYITGATGIYATVPSAVSPGSIHGGFDAFVVKIASVPRITGASISGKNLIVTGEGFDQGAVILVGGVEQRSKNDQSNPATVLVAKKAAKGIAQGQSVTIQVRNSDGLISEPFSFTRN